MYTLKSWIYGKHQHPAITGVIEEVMHLFCRCISSRSSTSAVQMKPWQRYIQCRLYQILKLPHYPTCAEFRNPGIIRPLPEGGLVFVQVLVLNLQRIFSTTILVSSFDQTRIFFFGLNMTQFRTKVPEWRCFVVCNVFSCIQSHPSLCLGLSLCTTKVQ